MVDAISTSPARLRTLTVTGAVALVLAASGCAHVSEDDFRAEIADVRTEMRNGDEALSSRIDRVERNMAALETELRTLESDFDMEIERLESSLRVHTPVHFGFDSAGLQGESRRVLDRIAAVLQEHYPTALVTIEGFTDPAGSEAYNLELGLRRAEAVRGWLVSNGGLVDDQVRAVSYGEARERQVRPGEAGPGTKGWQNRRVVVVIDHADSGTTGVVADRGQ